MPKPKIEEADYDELTKRRVPCLIAYLHPFRIVEAQALTPWSATIDQINTRTWDYVALHEMAGGIDVGLPPPFHLVIARDGALALPPDGLGSDQAAVEFFNRCLAALLIGGIYCEAITPDGLDLGSIIDWRFVRAHGVGSAAPNRFHKLVRYQQASALEAVALYQPRTISMDALTAAMKTGLDVLARVPSMRGEYLLRGVTGIARRDWGAALANLWIVAEQIISNLWQRDVVIPALADGQSKTRKDQLNDVRTWTAAARIEMLRQKGVLDLPTFTALGVARKARNDLSHQGIPPSDRNALAAYEGVCGALSVALPGEQLALFGLDLANHSLSDPFAPPKQLNVEPELWMAIPKLPGEAELEKGEAQSRRARTAAPSG